MTHGSVEMCAMEQTVNWMATALRHTAPGKVGLRHRIETRSDGNLEKAKTAAKHNEMNPSLDK